MLKNIFLQNDNSKINQKKLLFDPWKFYQK